MSTENFKSKSFKASELISSAFSIIPKPSLSHWTTVPALNKLPSKLINIRVQDKESTLSSKYNQNLIQKINNSIGSEGRILVRASGTEDLIRVLVEHSDVKQLNYFLDYFCDNIKKH